MASKKYTFPTNFLGKDKYMEEPEQIVMNNNNMKMDNEDEELVIPAKHISLQKLIDDYSENSSIENGSLCELNCIPCYNIGDKHFQSYSQKLHYYTTIGKDECPRIFDMSQFYSNHDSYSSNLSSPLRQKSFSNMNNDYSSNLVVSNTTNPSSSTTPVIPLNNSLNIDNNESYYSDTSMETNNANNNNNLQSSEFTYFIKTYNSEDEVYTVKSATIPSSSSSSSPLSSSFSPVLSTSQKNDSKFLKSKTLNLLKKTIPLKIISKNYISDEFKDTIYSTNHNDMDINETSILEKELVNDINGDDTSKKSQSSKLSIDSKLKLKNDMTIENTNGDDNVNDNNNNDDDDNNNKKKKQDQKEKQKKEKQNQKLLISKSNEIHSKLLKLNNEEAKIETKSKTGTKKEQKKEKEKEKEIVSINTTSNSNTKTTKKHRSSVSKYDFVKVLVYLSGEHYYVLSRFLISRMLTATKVDYYHAVRIALDLKKRLVDCNELELTQKKLEKILFNIMKEYGYNEKYTLLYKLISGFYRERIPMIILISGPRCVGKSTLATKLAERLNLPNIVKTDAVYDLMCSIFKISEEDREPIWYKNYSTDELLEKYENDCKLVKRGLEADIKKAFTEGKSIIIEGTHVTHYLYDFVLECIETFNQQKKINDSTSNTTTTNSSSSNELYSSKLLSNNNNNPCNAIVLPFYLDMDDKKCHQEFLYNQMMIETLINDNQNVDYFTLNQYPKNINSGNHQLCELELKLDIIGNLFRKENKKRLYQKSMTGESKAFKYINVNSKSFQSTLDVMHTEVLNKIQEKFSISE
ncbi:hypothetical protein BCR32DRAFT_291945 [Anaeromyces robustus]|uniref:P-loop containing nucleoside triphosphate hydrolase protein n=1 Tax=Anaeromyces robustus TaxID=1754192 RepID=A0A1Y1XCU4_9FUNG|nr:hypothetical protein BCR32DRAFT_291945 [Anaeromyces robustus]|eukprot:ORX83545.1 hypothetical protein BCR32DRAFT_291945 [Anaeromyces robustus]